MNILDKLDLKNCTGCHACYSSCPKKIIKMVSNKEGFLVPTIEMDKCVSCNICINACPVLNKKEIETENHVFGCYNLNHQQRLESASGGVFRVLAEEVIKNNGYVFGAGFNKEFQLEHMCASNMVELKLLLGTKYIQSKIGNTYNQAKELLEKGKYVLFSGTTCQIRGLKSFLKKDYDNLFTIDLICHGVPSPMVWNDYLDEKGRKHLKKIITRDKTYGMNNAPIVFIYDNGKETKEAYNENLYLKGFIHNLYLRESCFNCKFKGISRISDITIGDFWGLEYFDNSQQNDYGISVMISHNHRIDSFMKLLNNKMFIKEYPLEAAYTFNECLIKPVKMPRERNIFFRKYKENGFDKTVNDLSKKIDKRKSYESKIKSLYYIVYRIMKGVLKHERKK